MINELKNPEFMNKIVKQGNSLCVRIPLSVVKEVDLKEGEDVLITLHKIDYEKFGLFYEIEYIKTLNQVKELEYLSDTQKKVFAGLTFDLLKKTKDMDPKLGDKRYEKYVAEYEKEFGEKFVKEFIKFCEIVDKKVSITDKDGSTTIKKQFRY